jgi:hypothetical protein
VRLLNVPHNVAFLKDIVDGFFPYELKDEFPEGVPFKLIDKSSLMAAEFFGGGGAASGGGGYRNNVHSLGSLDAPQVRTQTVIPVSKHSLVCVVGTGPARSF